MSSSIYDIEVRTITGEVEKLENFKGRVLLIVNVASKCGLTPQYSALQALYEKYASQGFSVLGFPCNQFLEQEPGTENEIYEFCQTNYNVSFPMFSKIEVNGENRHPLYKILCEYEDKDGRSGDIAWNFEKFLISKNGDKVIRFRPQVAPDSEEIVKEIEKLLA